jgi:hypothetical protein
MILIPPLGFRQTDGRRRAAGAKSLDSARKSWSGIAGSEYLRVPAGDIRHDRSPIDLVVRLESGNLSLRGFGCGGYGIASATPAYARRSREGSRRGDYLRHEIEPLVASSTVGMCPDASVVRSPTQRSARLSPRLGCEW